MRRRARARTCRSFLRGRRLVRVKQNTGRRWLFIAAGVSLLVWGAWGATFCANAGWLALRSIVLISDGSICYEHYAWDADATGFAQDWENRRRPFTGCFRRAAARVSPPQLLPHRRRTRLAGDSSCGNCRPPPPMTLTTVKIPLWPLPALTTIPAGLLWWRHRRQRFLPGHCGRCGYDLVGNVSGKCPECGAAVPMGRERVEAPATPACKSEMGGARAKRSGQEPDGQGRMRG